MVYIFLHFSTSTSFSKVMFCLLFSGIFKQFSTLFLPALLCVSFTLQTKNVFLIHRWLSHCPLKICQSNRLKVILLRMVLKAFFLRLQDYLFTLTCHINFLSDYEMYYACSLASLFFYWCCFFNLNIFLPLLTYFILYNST